MHVCAVCKKSFHSCFLKERKWKGSRNSTTNTTKPHPNSSEHSTFCLFTHYNLVVQIEPASFQWLDNGSQLIFYMPIQHPFLFLSFSGCWKCGWSGHLRSQCPTKSSKGANRGRTTNAGSGTIRGRGDIRWRSAMRRRAANRPRDSYQGRGADQGRGAHQWSGRGTAGEFVNTNRGRVINIY